MTSCLSQKFDLSIFRREIFNLCLFCRKIKIYALFPRPESFCAEKPAVWKILAISASGDAMRPGQTALKEPTVLSIR